jgi:hypothetical protein
MQKPLFFAFLGLLSLGSFAAAQSQAPYYPPPAPPPAYQNNQANQLNPQVLGEMLRTAANFSELVHNMNLNHALGPDQHVVGADGQLHHSVQRTAETIGAGAGVGAAFGAMSRNQNGVMIGALIGGAGGLIIDQVMKHREELQAKAAYGSTPGANQPDPRPYQYDPRQLRERDPNHP